MSTACGTPSYLAPEIVNGEKYSQACDIWCVGVILYILLCGYPPFQDEDNSQMTAAIKECKIDFPKEDWGKISPEAKDLITKCPTPLL